MQSVFVPLEKLPKHFSLSDKVSLCALKTQIAISYNKTGLKLFLKHPNLFITLRNIMEHTIITELFIQSIPSNIFIKPFRIKYTVITKLERLAMSKLYGTMSFGIIAFDLDKSELTQFGETISLWIV